MMPKLKQPGGKQPERKQPRRNPNIRAGLPSLNGLKPTSNYDTELNEQWKGLFMRKQRNKIFYKRKFDSAQQKVDIDSDEFKQKAKEYGHDLAVLMLSETSFKTRVPTYLVDRSLTGRTKKDGVPDDVPIIINFEEVTKSSIPVKGKNGIVYEAAGDTLSNKMLSLAFNLVTPNIRNIGFVLLIIRQYRTKQNNHNLKSLNTDTRSISLKYQKYQELPTLLQTLDLCMEQCLPFHPKSIRNTWQCNSYGNDTIVTDVEVQKYRDHIRHEYLRKEKDLDRLHFFHLALIMASSQTENDLEGVKRINTLVMSGNWRYDGNDPLGDGYSRIGPKSFIRPLRFCSYWELLEFYSRLSGGLNITRSTTVVELAILTATVWNKELPKNCYPLLNIYQFSFKKARVTFNGFGKTDGVGVDRHVKYGLDAFSGDDLKEGEWDLYCRTLPINIARNVNDNLAEIGQTLRSIGNTEQKEWMATLLAKLRQFDTRFNTIIPRWLHTYGLDDNFQRIKKAKTR
eukprot:scaffold15704_cov165-Skeletonema_dohrnii-CCMP3373.AAC.2